MPIISRTIDSIQQTTGGIFAAFPCVDSKGREWRRSRSRFVDEATAQNRAAMLSIAALNLSKYQGLALDSLTD